MSTSLLIYSYKGKDLLRVVENALNTATGKVSVIVNDQVPIIRKKQLEALGDVSYTHQFWDKIESPCNLKHEQIGLAKSKYICMISDDVLLEKGWDEKLIGFVKDNRMIVSGQGSLTVEYDKYFLKQVRGPSTSFELSNFIDRNLVFGLTELFQNMPYPKDVKYYGEEEMLSIQCYQNQIDIYSAPSGLYYDLEARPLENLYTPFSIEHNYHLAIEKMLTVGINWCKWHKIDAEKLSKIPDQKNDVSYNPYNLEFNKIEQERFIDNVNGIY